MIQVTVGTNLKNATISVDETTTTPKSLFIEQGVIIDRTTNYLDGNILSDEDLNLTFADLGVIDSCALISVIKLNNA